MFAKYEKKPLGCLQITPLFGLSCLISLVWLLFLPFTCYPIFHIILQKKIKKNACAAILKVFWDKVFDSILSQ